MGELEGRVAFVTGAGRGQGRAHAVAFAREGADVILCDIAAPLSEVPYHMSSEDDLAETVRMIEKYDRRAFSRVADVRDPQAIKDLVADGVAELGHVDILAANAGINAPSALEQMTPETWSIAIDTNLTGVFNAIRAVGPYMIEQRWGRIIATASTAGRQGQQNIGNYSAAKWGVIGLVKTAAMEWGKYNITANAVCPALVQTTMTNDPYLYKLFRPELENPGLADIEEIILSDFHELPDAWIQPEEVSEILVFLASERGKHMSGSAIDITAGMSARWSA
jgi:SDR family mycofactocin-dependent oxidoreductase